MTLPRRLICSSHTISGVMPGGPVAARHPFERRVAACAAAGYQGMCLHLRDYRALVAAGRDEGWLAAVLLRHGIVEISLEFLTDWFLDGADGEQSRLDEATAYAAARTLGAHTFNVGPDLQGRGIGFGLMRRRLAALCERAAGQGLKVAVEIVAWSNVRDTDTALALIDGLPNAGLVIDAWHVFRGGVPLADLERIPGDRIFAIQVTDAALTVRGPLAEDTLHRRPCGDGVFDLDGFLSSLDRACAQVPVSVEIISPQLARLDVAEAARRSIAGARRLIERMGSRPPV